MGTWTPRRWSTDGDEPDPRWSLANERTLLAYQRTALGLIVAGFAVAGSRTVADAPVWVAMIGLPLLVLGGAMGLEGRARFLATQRALRSGAPLSPPHAAMFLPVGLAAVALAGLVVGMLQLVAG